MSFSIRGGGPITQAHELFQMAAFLFLIGAGSLIWAFFDYRRLKTWKSFVKAGSLRLLIGGSAFVLFSLGWFVGGLQALQQGHP